MRRTNPRIFFRFSRSTAPRAASQLERADSAMIWSKSPSANPTTWASHDDTRSRVLQNPLILIVEQWNRGADEPPRRCQVRAWRGTVGDPDESRAENATPAGSMTGPPVSG